MPHNTRSKTAVWTIEDEKMLLHFLAEKSAAASDGVNFTNATFQQVSAHLEEYRTKGVTKTAAMCAEKWATLYRAFLAIQAIVGHTEWTWSDEYGANIQKGSPVENRWKIFVKCYPEAKPFQTRGWVHLDTMRRVFPFTARELNMESLHKSGWDTDLIEPVAAWWRPETSQEQEEGQKWLEKYHMTPQKFRFRKDFILARDRDWSNIFPICHEGVSGWPKNLDDGLPRHMLLPKRSEDCFPGRNVHNQKVDWIPKACQVKVKSSQDSDFNHVVGEIGELDLEYQGPLILRPIEKGVETPAEDEPQVQTASPAQGPSVTATRKRWHAYLDVPVQLTKKSRVSYRADVLNGLAKSIH